MKFRPLHDRVLVERIDEDEKTAGGIIIPDTAKEKPSEGKVVAVGSGTKAEDGSVTPLDVKSGDLILERFSSIVSPVTVIQSPFSILFSSIYLRTDGTPPILWRSFIKYFPLGLRLAI